MHRSPSGLLRSLGILLVCALTPRRSSSTWALLLLLLGALPGCRSKGDPTVTRGAGPGPSGAPAAEPPRPGRELNLFAWSEYVPREVIDGFSRETGIEVHHETYSSNEEMLSKLLAGGAPYDLILPSEYVVEALVKQNKLAPIDPSLVPNLRNIDPKLKGLPHDPENRFSVPWMTGTVGIVVNTEKIKEPIQGYKDVFQPKHKGRIVALNDNRELVAWALEASGLDANAITTDNLAKVKPLLAEWVKLVKVFDSDSPKTALLNGDVDLGVVWSGEAALLIQHSKKFVYVLPEEGAHQFIDSLAIPATAPNKIGAMLFMNHVLRPEVSKLISDKFPYTNPNLEARKLLTPEQLANPASYPPPGERTTFRDIGKMAAAVDELVTDVKASH